MKYLIIITLLFISNFASAKRISSSDRAFIESFDFYKKKSYFMALDKIAKSYTHRTPDQNTKDYIEKLATFTGTHYFNTYSDLKLRKINIPTTQLIMAKRNLYLKKYSYAIKRLKKFPKTHRFYPESLLVLGTVYSMRGNDKESIKIYQECQKEAEKYEDSSNKKGRYYMYIRETCIINRARIYYRNKDYTTAIKEYNLIPKKSFQWPYILIEKAWSYHYLGDYNRSLGILVTYDSPLMSSYFNPESEVLKALNYYKLCLYQDSMEVIERFYKVYKPKSDRLRKVINSQKGKRLYFFNLMFSPIEESEKEHVFLRNLITQVSKRVKYNLDINSLQAIDTEIFRGAKGADMGLLLKMQRDLKEQINHYVKVSMIKTINKIHQFSYEMFNIKLEVLSNQRSLAYRSKTLKSNRARGSIDHVKRTSQEEFWKFKQEFWADELGDYSFGLKSQCKR